MSAVEMRSKTTIRHEYYVKAPACWTDVQMAIHLASEAWKKNAIKSLMTNEDRVPYDNSVMVDFDDENIIVYWEEKQ